MTASRSLGVWLHGRRVGRLDELAAGEMRLAYDEDYFEAHAPVLSLSLRRREQAGRQVRNWFANLLPEGDARLAAAHAADVNPNDEFALLEAFGRDCAGAVALWPLDEAPPARGSAIAFEPCPLERVEQWIEFPRRFHLAEGNIARLSLAGAQHKAAVLVLEDDFLALPLDGDPSSHILKIPNRELPGIVALEAFGMRLAAAAGLRVAEVSLFPTRPASLLVTRFDRIPDGGRAMRRLHQEDACQARGIAAEDKYEEHGGPSLADVADLLRRWGSHPARLSRFVDTVVFNAILGNADAHGKNFGLLYDETGAVDLAPAYDLVPSAMIGGIDRHLAMRIGGATTVDAIGNEDWVGFANACGIAPRLVVQSRERLMAATLAAMDDVCQALAEEGAPVRLVESAALTIEARARAVASGGAMPAPPPRERRRVEPWG